MPSKDRMGEFLAKKARSSFRGLKEQLHARLQNESPVNSPKMVDRNVGIRIVSSSTETFLAKVEHVSQRITLLSTRVEELRQIQVLIISSPLNELGQHKKVQSVTEEINLLTLDIHKRLQDLDSDIRGISTNQSNITTLRICQAQRASLREKLQNALLQYSSVETDYRQRCAQRLQRQLQIVGRPAATQEEIDVMLRSPSPNSLFTQGVISDTQKVKKTLMDLQERHEELEALEKSITEVWNLFGGLGLLIESQGEVVDRIESNVTITRDVLADTGSLLKEARTMKRTARNRKTKLIIIGTFLALFIVTAIVLAILYGR